MIFRDDLVKERSESVETFMAARIDTNTRVGPLATREDALLESVSESVFLVLALVPDVTGKGFGEKRFGSTWEVREHGHLFWTLQV